ncbi:MAG: ATPase, T2SS/T4P/T4SS family [Candidatus Saccharibacteria bacterium]|nr:Flp pilus assembly complex ATPase component TadA [Candidatus Saccharibacteria bacterium]MDO4967290.1 ATPase, T2SS/T4P/T4SS family [Candidatus Saccharibacteria bacterium]
MDEQEIQQKRRDNEEAATQNRARILGLPYLDTRSFENTIPLVPNVIDKSEMHENYIIPLQKGGNEEHYQFMVTSQTPRSVIDKKTQQYANYGEKVDFFLISLSGYNVFMLRYDPPKEVHYDDIKIASEGDSETLASVSQTLNSVGTDKVFDFLLDQADRLGASDIHIENLRDSIRIRMRVDGILHPVANINRDRYRVFMGELSSRAGVSTAATTPQSGHMQKDVFVDGVSHLLNIRVETIPTMYGQDAVLRLFNFDESLLNLDLLGLTEEELAEIREVVSHPRGLVLMVGPTGSGKSTTLYSIINALNSTDRKIITLEDPIEYGITGISQIPIDTTGGGSFADGLRSVLRLDPDVVMVGEIRDGDTAKTAIQASITGHLVLSSFHANTTAAAFSRMIDLIGTNPIFSSSIRMVIAQRLVRHLSDSKEAYTPDEATKKYIARVLDGLSNETISEKLGFDFNPDDYKLYKAVPSGEEDPFGYKGRNVIMEQLSVTEEIQKYIRGDVEDINTDAIEKTAKGIGMITLEQKGVLAALRGDTTLDEVARVI